MERNIKELRSLEQFCKFENGHVGKHGNGHIGIELLKKYCKINGLEK